MLNKQYAPLLLVTSGVKLLTEESSFTSGVDGRTVLDICIQNKQILHTKNKDNKSYYSKIELLAIPPSSRVLQTNKVKSTSTRTYLLDFLPSIGSSMRPPRSHFALVVGSAVVERCRMHVTRSQLQIGIYAKPIKIAQKRNCL